MHKGPSSASREAALGLSRLAGAYPMFRSCAVAEDDLGGAFGLLKDHVAQREAPSGFLPVPEREAVPVVAQAAGCAARCTLMLYACDV